LAAWSARYNRGAMDQGRPATITFPVGSLTVIVGSMFSGKTEEMIRRVRRATYARKRVQIFKHALDTRSEPEEIRSHAGVRITAAPVASSEDLLGRIQARTDLVAVE
jgi:thymidine kinase